jgi:hypothetical protein
MKQGVKTLRVRASTVYRGPILKGKISGCREAGGTSIFAETSIFTAQ